MAQIVMQFPKKPCVKAATNHFVDTIDKGQKYFRISFVCEKTQRFLYLTFPTLGGVRIRNKNAGFFEPEDLFDIDYCEQDDETLLISAKGQQVIFHHNDSTWFFEIPTAGENPLIIGKENLYFAFNIDNVFESVYLKLPLAQEEKLFGFGERFNSLTQKKITLQMWNLDCCDGLPLSSLSNDFGEKTQAYKNVPIVHSTAGYTVFFNTFYPIDFDIGVTEHHIFRTQIYADQFDLFIWNGTKTENLSSYLKLTGTPFLPPKWAFNYWDGGASNIWNQPSREGAFDKICNTLDTYAEHGIPVVADYLEIQPEQRIFDALKERNVRLLTWTHHALRPNREGSEYPFDDVYVKKMSNPDEVMPFGYVDFTDPASVDIICDKLSPLWDNGQHGMMIDFADSLPEDSLFYNGKTGREMHNFYAYWYAKRMNQAFYERMGNDFVLFQRAGCAGAQHYTGHFGGDMRSNFLGLKRSVHAALSAAASGFSVWGSDLGGFFANTTDDSNEEVYMRWTQFSAFSPLMRNHGMTVHTPWTFGKRALENFKFYDSIRISLIDKIYSSAISASKNGSTMIKSMAVAFEGDPDNESQYLFCDDFMVAPIYKAGQQEVEITLPTDGWINFYTGAVLNSGKHTVNAPIDRIPILIREGSVIPVLVDSDKLLPSLNEEKLTKALIVTTPLKERDTVFYQDKNTNVHFLVKRDGKTITLRCNKAYDTDYVIIFGRTDLISLDDMEVIYDEKYNRTILKTCGKFEALSLEAGAI